jgi:ABC-2 type transport system ATP-binding protein
VAQPGSPGAAVSLRALTRTFGPLTAVDGLTFDVAPGELFGIVGPDGAGKTTTLRMLAGVLRPTSGRALIDGVDVGTDPEGANARLERLYRFSRLGEFTDRLAGKLSGGMKQKLSLSCCLIHHPRILLLDEPTFGVDPISRRDLWLIVHEMVGEGVTVIASTSYLDEAERCDRVLLLDQGRVLALDDPAALQASLVGSDTEGREPSLEEVFIRLVGAVDA